MSDLNTTFVNGSAGGTPMDAAWCNAANQRMRSRLPVFDIVEDYGAKVDGVTDDTAAWQAALNAAGVSGGRIISSKSGVSVIAGALQDPTGANAQLTLPQVNYVTAKNVTIVIEGPTPPPNVFSVIGATPLPDAHLVLKSTLTTGNGALLGGVGPSGTTAGFTNVTLRMENATFRMPADPTNSALDLRRVACVDLDNIIVDASNYYCEGISAQTIASSFGIRLPGNNNGAHTRLGQVDVIGYYNGYEFAEHTFGQYVAAWACRKAFTFLSTNHASKFQRLASYHCQRGIVSTGTHYVDIDQYDIEHASTGTWVPVNDVDDASNYLHGTLWWHVVLANSGIDATFTKNGGTSLNAYRVGTAMGGNGSTSVYKGRDRLTAAAGNSVLTLGASPVAGSPLVWVDNVIKWPGTDYTIAGSVITFSAALAAGDIVLVAYDTLTANPGASALSGGATTGTAPVAVASSSAAAATLSISDDFNRADSTSSMGSTSVGAKPWTAESGTWGISSNKAYVSSGPSSTVARTTIDAGITSGTVKATYTMGTGGTTGGFVIRSDGAGNEYLVEFSNASQAPNIYKGVNGSYTIIGSGAATSVADGSVMTVIISGNTITLQDDGVTIATATTDGSYAAQTRHGLYIVAPNGGVGTMRWDDFSIHS